MKFDHVTAPQRVLFGSGSALANAELALTDLGARSILLVADRFAKDIADAAVERLPVVARVGRVAQHVPVDHAREAVELARTTSADAILTIGGGSSTGLGKIVARDTKLPMVAVPTTFAGSEATNVWGLTEANRKETGVDDSVLPKAVVYDATLMTGMPPSLAVASGMNAIAHAVDGFWAPRADPINRALGTEGLHAIVRGLKAITLEPESIEAREQTAYGAYLAAVAFASAGSGMEHKICHALGGAYYLPHADTHSVMIGYVTAFNAAAAPDAARRVTAALGNGLPAGRGLAAFARALGTPTSLRELGLREADLDEAADLIWPSIPKTNPRPVTRRALRDLLQSAWAGEELT